MYRQTIYDANIERIKAHNAKANEYGYTMGINNFADLTADEWTALVSSSTQHKQRIRYRETGKTIICCYGLT